MSPVMKVLGRTLVTKSPAKLEVSGDAVVLLTSMPFHERFFTKLVVYHMFTLD